MVSHEIIGNLPNLQAATLAISLQIAAMLGPEHIIQAETMISFIPKFTVLREFELYNATFITSDTLLTLSKELPFLRELRLINNYIKDMSILRIQSKSLENLYLLHFHELVEVDLICPRLSSIVLDNCGKVLVGERSVTAESTFIEKALQKICDQGGCPNLRVFHGFPTTDSMKPMYETALDPVDLNISHPSLREITLTHCSNLRSATFACPDLEKIYFYWLDTLQHLNLACPSLYQLQIKLCPQLRDPTIDAPKLHAFIKE